MPCRDVDFLRENKFRWVHIDDEKPREAAGKGLSAVIPSLYDYASRKQVSFHASQMFIFMSCTQAILTTGCRSELMISLNLFMSGDRHPHRIVKTFCKIALLEWIKHTK